MNARNMLKHRVNIYRRYYHWRDSKCIFIHIPKAAGTSLNKAIYGRTLGHYTADEIKACFPDLFLNLFVFSFVRNPWDRIVSAYRFAKIGKTDTMGVYRPEQYQIPEFKSFERFLFEWLDKKCFNEIDYIFQPQSKFVIGTMGETLVDYIGKVETLSSDIKKVESELGRTLDVGRENSTSNQLDFRNAYVNDDMIKLVGTLYSDDITRFGYSFDKS